MYLAQTHGPGHGTAYRWSDPSVIPLSYSGAPRLCTHFKPPFTNKCKGKSHGPSHRPTAYRYCPMEGTYLFNGQFPAHFLYFCLFNTAVNINFAADWIRTADLCCQKRPLYQLCHNHCTISVDSWYMIFYSALGINKQTDTRGCWIWGEGRRMSITSKFWILCKSKDATIASSSCRYFSTQK